jgi:hypothetical protein
MSRILIALLIATIGIAAAQDAAAQSAMPIPPKPPVREVLKVIVEPPMPQAPMPSPPEQPGPVVFCVIPNQGYCSIPTSSPVAPGSDCSCDGMAGLTQ